MPATLIWGELDQIAPVAVADYVWEHTLKDRAAPAGYWRIPCANHYLQIDQPELLADLVRSTVGGDLVSLAVAQDCHPLPDRVNRIYWHHLVLGLCTAHSAYTRRSL